ncbi:MAG TPA: ATP-binding protein [Pedomonas sp.]|uniref:PAS domain-containing sensor histidine kinase n=1 Tax=Pedomonas sp. TaxID=2976421 RepID=UPI002F427ACE
MTLAQINDRRFELLVKAVVDYAIYMLDPQGHVVSWNSGAQRIKGYSEADVVGRHYEMFFTPEDRDCGTPDFALANALKNGRHEAEGWRVRKDGTRFWASVVVDSIRDDNGQHLGFAKVTRDMTSQRNAQLALSLTREQLAQAQKMEAIGKLTGGVAHDFNNLLMIINGYADILRRRLEAPEDVTAIDTIRHAAQRGRNLTRQLLAFSRREPLNPVVMDPARKISEMRDLITGSLRGDLDLEIELPPVLHPVRIDAGEFELAMVNLAINARDAMPQGGRLTIKAQNVALPNGDAPHLRGQFVSIAISDTGTGIAPEHLSKIFDPFFTTKDAKNGSGLGLPQVYGFAARSGGTVTVNSTLWKGTTFTIYLPRANAGLEKARAPEAPELRELPGGTALLVEDNQDVATVTASMLHELGYQVVRAASASDALEHLRAGVRVDFMLSDIIMPGSINGVELEDIVRRNYSLVPVLLMTGCSDNALQQNLERPVLRKPFDIEMLRQALFNMVYDSTVAAQA